jgi:DNA polymerase I
MQKAALPNKRLVIVDGFSLLFRAFFGTRYLSTADGRPTNALFGFTTMLFYVLEHHKPDALVVAWDAPGQTFRHAEYAEYKGTRKDPDEALLAQIEPARRLITELGVPLLECTGYEADDVVGTLSRQAEEKGYFTTIVTGDNDQLQLVDECVSVLTTRVGVTDTKTYTPAEVFERYGVPPERLPDWKAIVGDTSDNIPGVPGIGEKGATVLLKEWDSVENLLANLGLVEEKYRKKIEPVKEQLPKSKWLATIVRDAPVEYGFEPFRLEPDEVAVAMSMLESFEFRSLLKRAGTVLGPYVEGEIGSVPPAEVKEESLEVRTQEAGTAEDLVAFAAGRPYAIHFETSGAAQPDMFAELPETRAFVAVGNEVRVATAEQARYLFGRIPGGAILHDAKPLYKQVPTHTPLWFDTMLACYVLQSGRSSYDVRDCIQGYLDVTPPAQGEQFAAALWQLEKAMRERICKEGQERVLFEIEQPLVPVLAEMEETGIQASPDFLNEFSKSLEVEIESAAKRVYELAGEEFNIGSPKQLGEVLFEKLGLPAEKKTKTGYATGAEILQVLAPNWPICTEILTWRELTKLKSTYADSLPKMIGPDGRIHTSYNQTVAATGRLSSNEPNLQNIPIRTELGRQIRKAFVAAQGFRLASFDYSQIELRLLAHLCRDEALVEAFAKREDVHAVTAGLMFGASLDGVTKEQRRYAKMLNYAVLYGVTDFGLANQLGGGFSVAEARALIQQYFERFPKVKAFTESVIEDARAKSFTTTLCGRRRYFPDIHAQNRNERHAAERAAVNAPIQGAAADMIKLAMLEVRKTLGTSATRMLLQVHDELVFELAEGEEALIEPIRQKMERAMPLDVPVEVDAKVGPNWNEMSEVSRPEA